MKKEHWVAIGLFIIALITIYESLRLYIWKQGYPSSGTFPFLLGILLTILSTMYFLLAGLKERKRSVGDVLRSQWSNEPEPVLEASKADWRKVLFSMGAVMAYPFLFMWCGYVISTVIFLFFMCKFVERQRILASLAIIFLTITASYTIFALLLKIPLK